MEKTKIETEGIQIEIREHSTFGYIYIAVKGKNTNTGILSNPKDIFDKIEFIKSQLNIQPVDLTPILTAIDRAR